MPKRFDNAIKALEKDMAYRTGKVILKHQELQNDNMIKHLIDYESKEIKHIKEAIKILENHGSNKHV